LTVSDGRFCHKARAVAAHFLRVFVDRVRTGRIIGQFPLGTDLARCSTMVTLGKARRALLAKQLSDLANLAVAALVFGQFIRGQQFSAKALVAGVGLWMIFAAMAFAVSEGAES
jgi:hypothetical protein